MALAARRKCSGNIHARTCLSVLSRDSLGSSHQSLREPDPACYTFSLCFSLLIGMVRYAEWVQQDSSCPAHFIELWSSWIPDYDDGKSVYALPEVSLFDVKRLVNDLSLLSAHRDGGTSLLSCSPHDTSQTGNLSDSLVINHATRSVTFVLSCAHITLITIPRVFANYCHRKSPDDECKCAWGVVLCNRHPADVV